METHGLKNGIIVLVKKGLTNKRINERTARRRTLLAGVSGVRGAGRCQGLHPRLCGNPNDEHGAQRVRARGEPHHGQAAGADGGINGLV